MNEQMNEWKEWLSNRDKKQTILFLTQVCIKIERERKDCIYVHKNTI